MKIQEVPRQKIENALQRFCNITDIKNEFVDDTLDWIITEKGQVYYKTMMYALKNWIDGKYPDIKKPYRITAQFVAQCITQYIKNKRSESMAKADHSTGSQDYNPGPRAIKMKELKDHCQQNNIQWDKMYGHLVVNPNTDQFTTEQIIEQYETMEN